jgi:hypothetical protein
MYSEVYDTAKFSFMQWIKLDMYFINLNVIPLYQMLKLKIMLENQKLHNQPWQYLG